MDEQESSNFLDGTYRSKRRARTCFSKRQLEELEKLFQTNHYPDQAARRRLVETLRIEDAIVQIWFKNRRAKDRKISKNPPPAPTVEPELYTYSNVITISPTQVLTPHAGQATTCQNIKPVAYFTQNSVNRTMYQDHPVGYYAQYPCIMEGMYQPNAPQQHYYYPNIPIEQAGYYGYPSPISQVAQSCPSLDSQNVLHNFVGMDDKENAP